MFENTIEVEKKKEKSSMDIKRRYWFHFERIDNAPKQHHLLYQLPTGGGKTVVFSEIVRRYLSKSDKSSRWHTELSCVNKRQRC
jgi:superfamily II DNA or RNA helicase